MERCAALLQALAKRRDAQWFVEPVSAEDAPDYAEYVKNPMDLGTIGSNLSAGKYADAHAFASDVRLVASNAVTYSPEPDNECHRSARQMISEFEKQFVKAGLATDGGVAAAAALEACKVTTTRKRKSGAR